MLNNVQKICNDSLKRTRGYSTLPFAYEDPTYKTNTQQNSKC